MVLLWLFLTIAAEPVSTIQVENFGRYLPDVTYTRAFLAKDNTFLVTSSYHVWHWDAQGKLINVFGGKGEGPGEFLFVGTTHWDGTHYWALDAMNAKSSIFDKEGRFLKQAPFSFRQFVPTEDELFILDYSAVNTIAGNFPQVLHKVDYAISPQGDLSVRKVEPSSKRVTALQKDFSYNFKLVWMVREGENYLVVDQLEPKIRIYSPEAIARENQAGDKQPFEPTSMNLQARQWVEPIKLPTNPSNERTYIEWWWSWSRINYFGKAGDDYILAYEKPDPNDPAAAIQIIQRIGKDGRALGDTLTLEGFVMGVRDNQVYVFKESDSEVGFSYWIYVYDF